MDKRSLKKEIKKLVRTTLSRASSRSKTNPKYGWFRDTPDERDYPFSRVAKLDRATVFQPVDLRTTPLHPIVLDQGQLGSCTAFGTTYITHFVRDKLNKTPHFYPSTLFTYYVTRILQGTVTQDSGASVRNAMMSVNKYGMVDETLWPYDITKFKTNPPQNVYTQALNHKAMNYYRIPDGDTTAMQQCLADGYPFVFGFTVFEQFESNKCYQDGIVEVPKKTKKGILGGHCMACVGWKVINGKNYFITQNSWGTSGLGNGGFWYFPFEYFQNKKIANDFWTVRVQE